jgi:hypothetical protein
MCCTRRSPAALVTAYGSDGEASGKSSRTGTPSPCPYTLVELTCMMRLTPAASAARQTFSVPVTSTE